MQYQIKHINSKKVNALLAPEKELYRPCISLKKIFLFFMSLMFIMCLAGCGEIEENNFNNIKPIIGLELEVEDFLICLLSKDEVGYKNIVKYPSRRWLVA